MFRPQTLSIATHNQILQKTLDFLAFQPQHSLQLDDYALTPLIANQPQQQVDQPLQVTIPLLRDKKMHWTLTIEQETNFLSIRIATGARINQCQLIITIKNKDIFQIDGAELVDNSWIECKLSQKLVKGQYDCEIYSPDADNQNNVLFLWLTTKYPLNTHNIILTQQYGLEPIVLQNKIIKQEYPLLQSNVLQWTWHQADYQAIKQLKLKLGTGNRNNTCQLQLNIFTLDWQFITESIINAQAVKDGEWTVFPLHHSLAENTTYIIQLSSPDATVDNAIFVYLQQVGLQHYQFKPVTEYKKYTKNDTIALFLFIPPFIYNIDQLRHCVQQITAQTTHHWQLFIISAENHQYMELLQSYQQQYPQQIYFISDDFKQLNLNAQYYCFLQSNHILEPNALEIILSEFANNPQIQTISTDSDTLTCHDEFVQPCFQSQYITQETLYFYRHEAVPTLPQCNFSWEWIANNLKNWQLNHQIAYLPFILQTYYQNQLQQQLNTIDVQQTRHIAKILYHQYPRYHLQNKFFTPTFFTTKLKVSIIIPNKDLYQDLQRCIESIIHNTTYENWEIVIVDNGSQQVETFTLYQYYQQKLVNKFKQITCDIPFNFSKLVNIGVEYATGDMILLLNNDTQILQPQNWLEKMLSFTQQKNIAAVGCKLIYPQDNTIQHAGIICGIGGIANHGHKHQLMYSQGYCNRLYYPNFYTAITGACLLVSKDLWQQVGGFDEKLAVAFNDVDFCLKLQQLAYQHVVLPDVYIYHYESKSRGLETTVEQKQRLAAETAIMRQRWGDLLDNDPYYNPHLTKKGEDFSLHEDSIYYARK
jgi:GT2 family glycosyltransferase